MSILSISPEELKLADEKISNNTWRVYRNVGSVIVFVHGVLSNSKACWYNAKADTFWPDLVVQDKTFEDSSVFLAGYYTAFDSTIFGIADCARSLLSALRAATDHPAVLDHERIIFVCHSLGGVVARYMLERWREEFREKKIGLLLIASPSVGSHYANNLENLIRIMQHEAGRQLGWQSPDLVDLDRRFRDLLQEKLIPDIWGREACEHRFVLYHRYFSVILSHLAPVVAADSAARYFGDARILPDTDHASCVKPDSVNHPAHLLLREFYQEVKDRFPVTNWSPPAQFRRASDPLGRQLEATHVFRCKRIGFEAVINEDGDALNETSAIEITAIQANDEISWELDAWTESGHISPYVTVPDRTPLHVRIVDRMIEPTQISQKVIFEIAPSASNPTTCVLQSLDFNAYSMDAGELRRRQHARQDNTDFLQKSVRWEETQELLLSVRFPESMHLESNISVEAYQLIHGDDEDAEVFDEILTAKASQHLEYSELLRTVTLRVPDPPKWTAYRIVWQLGDSGQTTSPAELAVVQENRNRLLAIHELFAATSATNSDDKALDQKVKVLTAVAKLGEVVIAEIRRRAAAFNPGVPIRFDATQLELSLMAVDVTGTPEYEILRIVAGTAVTGGSWNLQLTLGDGIAGRAAKRLEPRIYNPSSSDRMKDAAYLPLTPGKRHAFLLSMPLWEATCGRHAYGVVNIGTFDKAHAVRLATLNDSESIKALSQYVTGEFLRGLLEATSS